MAPGGWAAGAGGYGRRDVVTDAVEVFGHLCPGGCGRVFPGDRLEDPAEVG